jgi:hypothetical protein
MLARIAYVFLTRVLAGVMLLPKHTSRTILYLYMEELSAINNSSITDDMSLDAILQAADARVAQLNAESRIPTAQDGAQRDELRRTMVETARELLPSAIKPYVMMDDIAHREDQPNEKAVAIDLPGCARIFFGPWTWIEERQQFEVSMPWRNKPFQVAGGNMEEFGDLLDAIARAREVYRSWATR